MQGLQCRVVQIRFEAFVYTAFGVEDGDIGQPIVRYLYRLAWHECSAFFVEYQCLERFSLVKVPLIALRNLTSGRALKNCGISGCDEAALLDATAAANTTVTTDIEERADTGSTPRTPGRRNTEEPRVVIVGAGFAGLAAANALKHASARVLIVDRHNHHLFQPLLYQVATASLSASDIAVPIRRQFRGFANVEVLLDEVVDVDRREKRVLTKASGPHAYDYLIVASGASYAYFGHPQWRRRCHALKSLMDATTIRNRLLAAFERAERAGPEDEKTRAITFVVVGGGPTGVELAGAIAELAKRTLPSDFRNIDPQAARILLIEAMPTVLGGFPEPLRDFAKRALEDKGVEVLLEMPVDEVRDNGVVADGKSIAADTVLWAAGVRTEDVGEWLGVETDKSGRVPVSGDLSLDDDPSVFVVGDAAQVRGADGRSLPALAAVAVQEGRHAGRVIGRDIEHEAALPPFRYRDRGILATIGRNAAVADLRWLRLKGWPAWMVWGIAHIYFLSGFRNRLKVFLEWTWAYVTNRRASRIIVDGSEN